MSKRLAFLVAPGKNQFIVMQGGGALFHDQLVANSVLSPGEILRCQTRGIRGSWIYIDTKKHTHISFGNRFLTDDAEYDVIHSFD